MQIKPYLIPAIIVVSLAQGCSFSYSSKSSSKSSSSISKSSASILSSPSSSITEEELYQEDISDYTTAYLSNTQFDRSSFSIGITEIATANGVTSWEHDEATLIAIGRGLKEAGLPEGVYQTYKSGIVNNNPLAMDIIQQGYDE
ncbi:MAG: putative lipoprotein [Methyloprofundus sp.]|nr:putative lipoprotein [Methyloprofundus sp.]